ncbi:MAG: VacB/RNase II family 3'-5' exoribonuclease [Desulfobulbaceae bacterium]|nr:VacB/RNase II family 3'-5' exoribonuclease [Desulfobulbaceae bacterium]
MLLWLYGYDKSVLAREIISHAAGGDIGREHLERLMRLGLIERHGRNRCRLAAGKLLTGSFSRADKGFGFVAVAGRAEDIFIPARKTAAAFHGDTVLVRLDKGGEGEIIGVTERRRTLLAGICRLEKRRGAERAIFLPEDGHYPEVLPLTVDGKNGSLADGKMVLARLVQLPSGSAESWPPNQARVVLEEVLGDPDSAFVQARLVILAHKLPLAFPQAAIDEAAAMPEPAWEPVWEPAWEVNRETSREPGDYPPGHSAGSRKDLRQVLHITIDGEDAKDFDDAIAIERHGDNFRLYVSIADVGHYVRPGSALDEEARKRGTSIYFPGMVIPMLPERLSNDLCSLKPREPRFCLTAILDFSADGKLLAKSFCRSLIISGRRCAYSEAAAVLKSQDQATERWQQAIVLASELAAALRQRRQENGAISLSIAEPIFTLDENGHTVSLAGRQNGPAHQLIEECMLAANIAVAKELTAKNRAFLYRIHEVPDEEKTENFYQLVCSLGLHPPPPALSPAWFAAVMGEAAGTAKEYVIGNLLLRTLRQARYAPENSGHFALAAACYCHFTSPIRRYPDLLTHRALARLFDGENEGSGWERLDEEGDWQSSRERLAITASREMNDRLRVIFMADRLGEIFVAVISGFSRTMIFIDIAEPPLTGAIALDTLPEYCFYDRERQRLTGEISRKILAIGDPLAVQLIEADRRRRRLHFVIAEKGGPGFRRSRRAAKGG